MFAKWLIDRMRNKNLNNLSNPDLEKQKLISEINHLNKSIWRQPSFWTFLIAITATLYSWQSGLFETKSKILELKTMQLDLRKDSLYSEIAYLQNQKLLIERKYDSLFVVVNKLEKEKERVEKEFESWKNIKQSKADLKNEILLFVNKLKDLIRQEEIRQEQKREKYERDNNWVNYTKYNNIMIRTYNNDYKTSAIIYREKLLYYLPKIKVDRNELFNYQYPTNPLGLQQITNNLEYMANKLVN